jgi:hypothetical protein
MYFCTAIEWGPKEESEPFGDGWIRRRSGWSAPLGCEIVARSRDDLRLEREDRREVATITLWRVGSGTPLVQMEARADQVYDLDLVGFESTGDSDGT